MKHFLVLALFVAAAYAAEDLAHAANRRLAVALEQRAEALVVSTQKTIEQQRSAGHTRLVGTLEHEMAMVEILAKELKTQVSDPNKSFDLHQVHILEEELVRHESRIREESSIIRELLERNPQNSTTTNPSTSNQLVTRAETLLKQGREALPKARSLEVRALQYEIHQIETLVKAIQANASQADHRLDELQLQRHERSLQVIVDRVNRHL